MVRRSLCALGAILARADRTRGYGDYYRTQSWFQAPGYDDWNQGTPGRNWKDAKLASSIAQLAPRRAWVCAP